MGIVCLNLADGTVVVGKEIHNDTIYGVELESILLLSTSTYAGSGTQVFLTKYNIFGDEPNMIFSQYTVISKYKASKYIRTFYKKFLEKAANTNVGLKPIMDDPASQSEPTPPISGASFLSEYENIINSQKFDIDDLRKNVKKIDDGFDEEDDNSEDYDDDDDDDENESK